LNLIFCHHYNGGALQQALMNTLDIWVRRGECIQALFISIDHVNKLSGSEKRDLKDKLREMSLPYYWTTKKYLEFKPGVYIFLEEQDRDTVLSHSLRSHAKVISIPALAYPSKFLLRDLIDRQLEKTQTDVLERIGRDMQGNVVYKFRQPLFSWPSQKSTIYEFHRRFLYRIEHVRHIGGYRSTGEVEYTDKLYLVPSITLQVDIKASLGDIVNAFNIENLSSLYFKRVTIIKNGQSKVGIIVDVNVDKFIATVQLRDEKVELSLNDVFLQKNPTWYRPFLEKIGINCSSSYNDLLDYIGLITYKFEPVAEHLRRRRQIQNAPIRYFNDLRDAVNQTVAKVFPIRFQEVEYALSTDFTPVEEV